MRETKDLNSKNKNSGITLIALIITIIVMLILVAVTVTMAVNGGLFSKAQTAGIQTNEAVRKEQELGSGKINIAGEWYNSPQEYVNEMQSSTCQLCQGTGICSQWSCPNGCINVDEPNEGWKNRWYCDMCEFTSGRLIVVSDVNATRNCPMHRDEPMYTISEFELVLTCPSCDSILVDEPVWSNDACTLCQEDA